MNKPARLVLKVFLHEPTVYLIFCIGIIYSMFLWPLLNSILCISLGAYWLAFSRKSFLFKSVKFRLIVLFVGLYLVFVIGIFYTANLQEGLFRLQQLATWLTPLSYDAWANPRHPRTLELGYRTFCPVHACVTQAQHNVNIPVALHKNFTTYRPADSPHMGVSWQLDERGGCLAW